eukprot:s186_g7.t1
MASCIYANRFTRLMKPEQFRQIERSAITTMAHKIREQWVVNIQKVILNNFRDVGKGWFSIHETNQDTYRQGKLKKLLAVVKNMMQDSLEFFTLDSVDDYCHGLEELCPEAVLVKDLNQVESQFVDRPRPKAAKRGGSLQLIPPGRTIRWRRPGAAFYGGDRDDDSVDLLPGSALFLLEIKISEEKAFVYSTSSEAAIDMCAEILDMGMMSLGDIPQVEPQIVPQLFKTVVVKQVLNTVDVNTPRDEGAPVPFVKARKATMMVNLKKARRKLCESQVHQSSSGPGHGDMRFWPIFPAAALASQWDAEFYRSPLRCPSVPWQHFLSQLKEAETLLRHGNAWEARQLLSHSDRDAWSLPGDALTDALGPGSGDPVKLRAALTECAVGLGAALRLGALAHVSDPAVRGAASEVQRRALEVALRLQHLAAGWLIYAYNGPARHRDAFIDASLWPINSADFGDEHRSVAALLQQLTGPMPERRAGGRASVVMVTICNYPEDSMLPRLAAFVHGIYAQRYAYRHHRHSRHASDRPAAWGKVAAMQEALQDGPYNWALWVDCDLFFMDLNKSLDPLLPPETGDGVKMVITEDAQTLNTAIFFMRRSEWSLKLLEKVWGGESSAFVDHTWWEQQAFVQELLGAAAQRCATLRYEAGAVYNGSHQVDPGEALVYPKEVNYFEVFCQLNDLEDRCKEAVAEGLDVLAEEERWTLMAPWLRGEKKTAVAQRAAGPQVQALPALDEYLSLFSEYEELLKLEPAAFVQTKVDAEITTGEAKQCILEQVEKESEVLDSIPESVVIGLFEVSCQEIRKSRAPGMAIEWEPVKISELLLEMLLTRFRDGAQEIIDGYSGIFSQLRKTPKDIEEVASMREYIGTVPAEIMKLAPDTKRCLDTYGVLEEFGVQLTADDFYQRWRVFGCPKSTFDLVAKVEDDIKELEAQFETAQQQEQADFYESIVDVAKTIENFSQYSEFEKLDEIYENVESVNERLKSAATQAKLFNSRETLFGKEVTDYSMIAQLTKEWEPFTQLWVTAFNWTKDSKKWLTGPFQQVDAKSCESSVAAGTKTLFKAVKAFEKREGCDEVLQIAKTIKDPTCFDIPLAQHALDRSMVPCSPQEQMDDFAPKVPLVVGLRNQGMADRHWEQVSNLIGSTVHPSMENFTLNNFIELGLVNHAAAVADIGDRAGKEQNIENQLKNMQAAWDKVYFDCSEPYRTTGTYILKGADEVMAVLDEQIVVTQAMQFSPFNKPFKEEIDEWNDKLMYVSECLDQWLKAWMYLQPIFDSPDIMKQLPTEGKKFKVVDGKWRQTMSRVHSNGHALTQCTQEGLLQQWQVVNKDLDMVQKGLDDYLATKCAAFARFYFLSNDELLEILSQTKARTQIGTPYYLSPEVCDEEPYAWPSDIWAMGCILFEMCALKVPFEGPNIHRLVQKILMGSVPLLPGSYSEWLRRLCSEMLERVPSRRPSAEDILKRSQLQTVVKQLLDEATFCHNLWCLCIGWRRSCHWLKTQEPLAQESQCWPQFPGGKDTPTMVSAGGYHTVLLRSDGRVVACGSNRCKQRSIPKGTYTQVSASSVHSVLLRSDGKAIAFGMNRDRQCNIPPLDKGMSYTQVSAGGQHTVLLRSDGSVVACGSNSSGQCSIPPLDEGVSYTQVSAGSSHTLLLCSDGNVVACGSKYYGQCDIPSLADGISYTQISAGLCHTALLRSDGRVVARGENGDGQCFIPPLDGEMSYTQVSAGGYHTVLLRSDGSVVACGSNSSGQCNIPPLADGISYIQVSAGLCHTALLRSDGRVVACGANDDRQCNIPSLKSWHELLTCASSSRRYSCDSAAVQKIPDRVIQMDFASDGDAVMLTCSSLAGCEVFCLKALRSDLVAETHQRVARELAVPLRSLRVVLPGGRVLADVLRANPVASLADVMVGAV